MPVHWLPWAPLFAAVLHISEEFLLPGGFAAWYRRYRTDSSRVTSRFLFLINAALIVGCVETALLGLTPPGIFYWLAIAAVLASNGLWHLWASVRSHGYSPGVVTGSLIYVPLAVYGYGQFLRSGRISLDNALAACVLGGSYPFWSAIYHGIRPRAKDRQIAK